MKEINYKTIHLTIESFQHDTNMYTWTKIGQIKEMHNLTPKSRRKKVTLTLRTLSWRRWSCSSASLFILLHSWASCRTSDASLSKFIICSSKELQRRGALEVLLGGGGRIVWTEARENLEGDRNECLLSLKNNPNLPWKSKIIIVIVLNQIKMIEPKDTTQGPYFL